MLLGISMGHWADGFTAEGPMFWTLVAMVLCLVYVRSNSAVTERQAKMEAEHARRQEHTYQAMVQHYRQVANEQQSRMDTVGQPVGSRSTGGGAGGVLELFQLLADNSAQKITRLETRLDVLSKELPETRRELADSSSTTGALLGNLSDMQHQLNNLNHAVGNWLDEKPPDGGRRP